MQKTKVQLATIIDADLKNKLDCFSKERRSKITQVIEVALNEFFEKEKNAEENYYKYWDNLEKISKEIEEANKKIKINNTKIIRSDVAFRIPTDVRDIIQEAADCLKLSDIDFIDMILTEFLKKPDMEIILAPINESEKEIYLLQTRISKDTKELLVSKSKSIGASYSALMEKAAYNVVKLHYADSEYMKKNSKSDQ